MPNRILKENICTSDTIDELSWFEEVLFYRLIVSCDDYGRYDGRPAIIKNKLFPLKENLTIKNVSAALNTLARVGLVTLYEYEGRPFLFLPTWEAHQTIRAKKSKYPDPATYARMKSSENICMQMLADVPVIQSNPNPIQSESNTESNTESARSRDASVPAEKESAEKKKIGKYVMLTTREYAELLQEFGTFEFMNRKKAVDFPENEGKDFYALIREAKV